MSENIHFVEKIRHAGQKTAQHCSASRNRALVIFSNDLRNPVFNINKLWYKNGHLSNFTV